MAFLLLGCVVTSSIGCRAPILHHLQHTTVIRFLPSFENGTFRMIDRVVEGHFTLTPPLPDTESLPERLSDELEWIDLVPYGNTLLRLTVFPDGMKRKETAR